MTARDLIENFHAVQFILSRPELQLRLLVAGPGIHTVMETLRRAAHIYTPILRAWPTVTPDQLGFEVLPMVANVVITN
jgi:hypothetical protein